jgi:RimJ/RimL family protein N-acetyltransferase
MKITGSEQLRGEGFLLRPIVESDAELMVAASQSDIPDWTFIPRSLDRGEAEAWIRRGLGAGETGRAIRFVIDTPNGAAGTVGAEHPYAHDDGIVETFYFVLPAFRRRGLATAALRLLNTWVGEVTPALRRLQLHVIVGNQGSSRVAELAGYQLEGIVQNQIPAVNGFGSRNAEAYGIAVEGSASAGEGGVLA